MTRQEAKPADTESLPSGSRGSDSTFDLQGRFLPGDMVNGNLIAAARTLLGWDQRELAERAGIRRHTLAALERDARKPHTRVRQAVLGTLERAGVRFIDIHTATGVALNSEAAGESAPALPGSRSTGS